MVLLLRLPSKVGPKGQAVIPKPIRDALHIHVGDQVYFRLDDGRAVLEKRSPLELVEEFIGGIQNKPGLPKHVDWDEEYVEGRGWD